MVKPRRLDEGRKKVFNGRTCKTKNDYNNCQNSRSSVRKLQLKKPRWRKSVAKRRIEDARSKAKSRVRKLFQQSEGGSGKHDRQRRQTQAKKRVTMKKDSTSRNCNSRAKANTRNNHNMQTVAGGVGNGQRKRYNGKEGGAACKRARLTLNGTEVALPLSNHNVQNSDDSLSPPYSAPVDNPDTPPLTWNLLEEWDEVVKNHPPAFHLNGSIGLWLGRPAPLRVIKMLIDKARQTNNPTTQQLPPHRQPVTYFPTKTKEYLDTPVNRCYVYHGAIKNMNENKILSVLTSFMDAKKVNDDPFGRPGFFESKDQDYYFQRAMCSGPGKKALEALNNVNLYLTEVNFQYELKNQEKDYLAGRWRQEHLVEIFTPRYIVVGLKYNKLRNKLEVNGCFPKRGVGDIYWALRGPHTPNAVYNINYNG